MKTKLFFTTLTVLFFAKLQAQIVNIPNAAFKAKLVSITASDQIAKNLSSNYTTVDTNGDGEIQVSEALQISVLKIVDEAITSMVGIESFTNLIELTCKSSHLSSLDLTALHSLQGLNCSNCTLSSLNITGLINLTMLACTENELTSLNLQGMNLTVLECNLNLLESLDLSGMTNLQFLACDMNPLSSLNVQGCVNLSFINANETGLSSFDPQGLTSLQALRCDWCLLSSLDLHDSSNLALVHCAHCPMLTYVNLEGVPDLYELQLINTSLTTLDVSEVEDLFMLDCRGNDELASIFMKDGTNNTYWEQYLLNNNPNLQYVCTDEAEIPYLTNYFASNGMPNVNVNSYCSFVPGGNYNTITGMATYDNEVDGCDPADDPWRNLKIRMTKGTNNYFTFTHTDGNYTYYLPAGNYTLSPVLENPAYFSVSPATTPISFPNGSNNTLTQNFCIAPNGIHSDLEIVIAPLTTARPGFDAQYKIIYKNKGNQIQSGSITLSFNDDLMDFISATSMVSTSGGTGSNAFLTWSFTDLQPFESGVIEVGFNLNTPMETPGVNGGDILSFTAVIGTPAGIDEMPADNLFDLHQTVVNSFDPNDIVCLEGNSVAPSYIGDYLHYIVNFENTGTAPAENVVVTIEIDPVKYDINSVQFLDASHPADTKITGNKIEFIMAGANLATDGGHGNVCLKLKTKPNLQPGNIVKSKANIYFDYNFPILTNEEQTIFTALSVSELPLAQNISVYPVPSTGIVNIEADSPIESIEIFDAMGRLLQTSLNPERQTQIDITTQRDGVYFFRIISDKGIKVQKVLKK